MSKKRSRMLGSASSEKIRKAVKHLQQMSQEQQIDLMVDARLLTPEQAERAKKKWAEIQVSKVIDERRPGCPARGNRS